MDAIPSSHGIKYVPLEAKRDIRILTVLRGNIEEPQIRCTLRSISLDAPPPYIALSYAWGDQYHTRDIVVSGQPHAATVNLEIALRYLREEDNDVDIWVDAICINQGEPEEIDQQLRFIRDIFQKAAETRVWLGPEENESDVAIELLGKLADIHEKRTHESDSTSIEAIDWASPLSSRPWTQDSELIALHNLLVRPYWYRVWVVQEIAASKTVTVFCGRQKIHWNTVRDAAEALIPHIEIERVVMESIQRICHDDSMELPRFQRTLRDGVQRILSIQSVRYDCMKSNEDEEPRDALLYLLSSHRSTGATDSRDKYLALAGLVAEEKSIIDQQKCTKPIPEIFMLAAESTAYGQPSGALDFLDFAGWPANADLPSWVPDWGYNRDRAVPLLYWQVAGKKHRDIILLNAAGANTAKSASTFRFRKEEGCLAARGFVLDTINGVGYSRWHDPCDSDIQVHNAEKAMTAKRRKISTTEIAESLWRTLVLDRAHADGLKAPSFWKEAFYRHFFLPAQGPDITTSQGLFYQENKNFQIRGFTLEQIAQEERDSFYGEHAASDQEVLDQIATSFNIAISYRRLASTSEHSYLCLVPSKSRIGDLIVILKDCHIPVVLRKETERNYSYVGSCYVHGIMQGEVVVGMSEEEKIAEEFEMR